MPRVSETEKSRVTPWVSNTRKLLEEATSSLSTSLSDSLFSNIGNLSLTVTKRLQELISAPQFIRSDEAHSFCAEAITTATELLSTCAKIADNTCIENLDKSFSLKDTCVLDDFQKTQSVYSDVSCLLDACLSVLCASVASFSLSEASRDSKSFRLFMDQRTEDALERCLSVLMRVCREYVAETFDENLAEAAMFGVASSVYASKTPDNKRARVSSAVPETEHVEEDDLSDVSSIASSSKSSDASVKLVVDDSSSDLGDDVGLDPFGIPEKQTRRRKSSGTHKKETAASILVKLFGVNISPLFAQLCEIFDICSVLAAGHVLQQRSLAMVAASAFPLLLVPGNRIPKLITLQLSAIKVVSVIFSVMEDENDTIFSDAVFSAMSFPKGRSMNTTEVKFGTRKTPINVRMKSLGLVSIVQATLGTSRKQQTTETVSLISEQVIVRCKKLVNVVFAYLLSSMKTVNVQSFLLDFCDDLVKMLGLPEWPAAKTLLHLIICAAFRVQERKKSFTIDFLGHLCAKLFLFFNKVKELETISAHPETCPLCLLNTTELDSVECSLCRMRFHKTCISRPRGRDVVCHYCEWKEFSRKTLESCVVSKLCKMEYDDLDSCTRDSLISKQALVLYFQQYKASDSHLANVLVQNYFSEWLTQANKSSNELKILSCMFSGTKPVLKKGDSLVKLQELCDKTVLLSFVGTPLVKSLDGILKFLLCMMVNKQSQVRQRSVKALAEVLDAEPGLFVFEGIRAAVNARLMDTFISVRQGAVDLVGNHLFECDDEKAFEEYYKALSVHVVDVGISVRKQVVSILGRICTDEHVFEMKPAIVTDACKRLAGRMHDEPSVQNGVLDAFRSIWFSSIERSRLHVRDLVNVVSVCDFKESSEWLGRLMSQSLETRRGKEICKSLVDCVVDILSSEDDDSLTRSCMATLDIMAVASPQLLVDHLVTLSPFLEHVNGKDDSDVISHAADIVRLTLPLTASRGSAITGRIRDMILSLVCTPQLDVIRSCVHALSVFEAMKDRVVIDAIAALFNMHFFLLQAVCEGRTLLAGDEDDDTRLRVWCSLYVLGILCQYCDVGKANPTMGTAKAVKNLYLEILPHIRTDSELMENFMHGLLSASSRWSELLQEEEIHRIVEIALSNKSDPSVRSVTLDVISDLLGTSSADANAEGATAAGITFAQSATQQCIDLVLDWDVNVRSSATFLIQVMVSRCVVSHMRVVAPLIASFSDPSQPRIVDTALKALQIIRQRPSVINSSHILNGIRQAYILQKKLWGHPLAFCWGTKTPNVHPVFGKLLTLAGKGKKGFMAVIQGLLKPFSFLDLSSSIPPSERQEEFLLFLAEIIAFLPYTITDQIQDTLAAINNLSLLHCSRYSSMASEQLKDNNGSLDGDTRNGIFALCLLMKLNQFLVNFYLGSSPIKTTPNSGSNRLTVHIENEQFPKKESPFSGLLVVTSKRNDSLLVDYFERLRTGDDDSDIIYGKDGKTTKKSKRK